MKRWLLAFCAVATSALTFACGGRPSKLYISQHGDDNIAVLDGTTYDVTDHIPVGQGPAILLDTPDHKKLYTANWVDSTISSVVIASKTVSTIAIGSRPFVIAMAPDGKTLYAGTVSQIAVIDTATDAILRTIPAPTTPMSLIVSPDSKTLYVALLNNQLEALNPATGDIIQQPIPVGNFPAWITISRDGSKVYTLNFLSSDITVVDTASWQVSTTISTGAGSNPIIGTPTPDGKILGVTNVGTADVSLIDTATNQVAHTLKLTGRPIGINFSADGKQGFTADFGPDSLNSDPFKLLLAGIQGAPYPFDIPGLLTVFDPQTGSVSHTTTLGSAPTSIVSITE